MARIKRRQPYDPNVHDRRTTDLLRNAKVSPIEVDDPMELGGKLIVMRSTRDDPLADLHARRMIDEAQYRGGRAFQEDFETAERGPRAIDPSKEAVDGGMALEPITEAQRKAARQLAVVYRALGQDGSALTHDVLVHMKTRKQVAASRGLVGERWEKYYGLRFQECLDCLALVYGFAMKKS
ncbi:hypothetical protein QIH93_14995 [Bradyrhizobium ottawaense]|uniref:hypothetical protein n=1 Tax=Bradyrhizobium ottawaense TaxID=931866 RepID=UPI002714585C|nr:hypothetical protein [Bradyrhizobium ottawaense]WLB49219.1 hypothetical protein QIH93_14995 [Bradyrhizobium ottawaense]